MAIHKRFLASGAAILLLLLLLPAVTAQGDDEKTSAWVQIDGQDKQSNLRSGNVLGTVDVVDGKCEGVPDFSMGLSDDLKSFQVGANPRTENDAATCDIVVRNMVFKEDDATGNTSSRARIPSVNYQDGFVCLWGMARPRREFIHVAKFHEVVRL